MGLAHLQEKVQNTRFSTLQSPRSFKLLSWLRTMGVNCRENTSHIFKLNYTNWQAEMTRATRTHRGDPSVTMAQLWILRAKPSCSRSLT